MSNMNTRKDSIGDRMKENYENRSKTYLTRRVPVIIRLDGRAFHSFTKGFNRPYDEIFHYAMNETTKYLCENIQGCKLGYTQSDEITLLLTDYDTVTTNAWFDYSVQKMCSISAAMATMKFNQSFFNKVMLEYSNYLEERDITGKDIDYFHALKKATTNGAMFDSRCFNIPKEEVINCFIWRQQDATRNAIQMLGQCNFSYKELQNKSCDKIQDMLMTQKNINFNDMPTQFKRGVCCVKESYTMTKDGESIMANDYNPEDVIYRTRWVLDTEIPVFTQDRHYIEKYL